MGHKKFYKNLGEVMILPSARTMRLYRNKIPRADGIREDICKKFRKLWFSKSRSRSGRLCILSWDATGYAKQLRFNKHTGILEGFAYSPEVFSAKQLFAKTVNCWMVSSPEVDNKIRFPLAYYHCASLNTADIMQQHKEVEHAIDAIGLKVVALVCYGASSEHASFFDDHLIETAKADPSIKVRRGDKWGLSDTQHLAKKFRNVLMSSGEHERYTKRLCIDGRHFGWKIIDAARKVSSYHPDGTTRSLIIIPGFDIDVTAPSSLQRYVCVLSSVHVPPCLTNTLCRLRVNLGVKAFSKQVILHLRRSYTREIV